MPHSDGVRSPSLKASMLVLALGAFLAGGAKCETTSLPEAGASSTAQAATNANQQLAALQVSAGGSMSGYSRDRFPHWISQGGGCDTRDVVLKREGQNVKVTGDCKIVSGTWHSLYDGKTYTDPQKLDVDHMVPLADAWRHGASSWTDEKRSQFANDL